MVTRCPHLNDIKCYDKDGKLFEDIMADETYNYCQQKSSSNRYERAKS